MEQSFLNGVKTIAVVGLSDNPGRPSYQVAEYLQSAGYRIIPVNPMVNAVLGETAYPSLNEIPQEIKIDLVDIFRKSEEVFPIVVHAIKLGAKYIWMQEGVKNVAAMKYAEEHGAIVAADICLMKTHKARQAFEV